MKIKLFTDVLRDARAGDPDAIESILVRYMPLINHHSAIDGKFDEDMRQHIIMHVIIKIPKFDPNKGHR